MRVRVLYFAYYKELAGVSEEELHLENGSTVEDFLEVIRRIHRSLEGEDKRMIVAVNNEYVRGENKLYDGDLIALFPPVSGG
ncbi:MAG: molybdopterin converting factor subunit 1 [Candidatus Bathyarchaeia archaeon]